MGIKALPCSNAAKDTLSFVLRAERAFEKHAEGESVHPKEVVPMLRYAGYAVSQDVLAPLLDGSRVTFPQWLDLVSSLEDLKAEASTVAENSVEAFQLSRA